MVTEYFDILKDNFKIEDNTALVLGVFDGVHKAHQSLIKEAKDYALSKNYISAVYTFNKSPKANEGFVTGNDLKEKYIKEINPDYLLFQEMSKEFMNLSPEEFVKLLNDKLNVKAIFVGENFTFGKDRAGNVDLLKKLGEKYGFSVFSKSLIKEDGETVSSTTVRNFLLNGEIKKANQMLRRDYEITGVVDYGNNIGHTLNFPTANIYPDEGMLLPKYGVYKSRTIIGNSQYKSITNVGIKPTAPKNRLSVETFILDFDRELYGQEITVKFKDFIREEKRFKNLDELKKQISKDIKKANED